MALRKKIVLATKNCKTNAPCLNAASLEQTLLVKEGKLVEIEPAGLEP